MSNIDNYSKLDIQYFSTLKFIGIAHWSILGVAYCTNDVIIVVIIQQYNLGLPGFVALGKGKLHGKANSVKLRDYCNTVYLIGPYLTGP